MKKIFWLSWIIAAGLCILIVKLEGGHLFTYFALSPLLICPGVTIALLYTHFSFKEIGNAFSCAMEKGKSTAADVNKAILFFKTAQNLVIGTGVLGTLIGISLILGTVTNAYKMGMASSVTLVSLIYGVGLTVFITIPFISALKKKLK